MNTIVDHCATGISVGTNFDTGGEVDVTIQNCTIDHNAGAGVLANGASGSALNLVNDLITNNGGAGVVKPGALFVDCTYSDVWNNTPSNFVGLAAGTGSLSADPLYAGASDYHLQAGSVAIDKGTPMGAPDHDFDLHPRPQDRRRHERRPVRHGSVRGRRGRRGRRQYCRTTAQSAAPMAAMPRMEGRTARTDRSGRTERRTRAVPRAATALPVHKGRVATPARRERRAVERPTEAPVGMAGKSGGERRAPRVATPVRTVTDQRAAPAAVAARRAAGEPGPLSLLLAMLLVRSRRPATAPRVSLTHEVRPGRRQEAWRRASTSLSVEGRLHQPAPLVELPALRS